MRARLYLRRCAWRGAMLLFTALLVALPLRQAHAIDARALDTLFDSVLGAHVEKGYVDYPAIAKNPRFQKYLNALDGVDTQAFTSDADALAFWINTYNALVIRNVIDGRTMLTGIARMRFFRLAEADIAGRSLDLNSIEEIIAGFGDPRALLALANGTYSGPMLRSGTYRGAELDSQLERAARDFVNDKRRNRFSRTLRRASLSALFEDKAEYFGGDDDEILRFVAGFLADEELARDMLREQFEVVYLEYEWSIDGVPM